TSNTPTTYPAGAGGTTQLVVPGLTASGFALPAKPGTIAPQPPGSPNYPIPWEPAFRAVIFSADGLTSQTRRITKFGGTLPTDTILWTEDIDGSGTVNAAADSGEDLNYNGNPDHYPLPATFTPGGRVRIEYQERRYSWLLTVRKDAAGGANVDVVVFFQRR